MKTRWLTPCFVLLASCASFAGDDTKGMDDDSDASTAFEEDAAADASSSVVMPPDEVIEGDADAVEDAGTVDAAPPPIDELTETYGVFVSLAGSSDGEGTRAAPLSSIGAGIAKAKQEGKRVYVCKGTYTEAIELKSGVSVFGGYACTTKWERKDGEYSRVEAPTSPAVRAKDVTDATTFSGFDVVAPGGKAADASSIGLIADNAGKLVVAASKITAGKGADGAAGVEPAAPVPGSVIDGKAGKERVSYTFAPGHPEKFTGGAGGTSQCGGGSGGVGATGAVSVCSKVEDPFFKYRYRPLAACYLSVHLPGQPTGWVADGDCREGQPGAGTGAPGTPGVDGQSASAMGTLSKLGYVPADGSVGTSGTAGAGGGGGKAQSSTDICSESTVGTTFNLPSGPGGGAGGCGGVAGTAGKGGGASVGALVWDSGGMVFDRTEIVASAGGAGGKGTLGASPTAGGFTTALPSGAWAGANGGDGGVPGVSGSGAGGPSLGMAYHGLAPAFANGATSKAGQGGAGASASSKTFNTKTWTLKPSATGLSKEKYEF